LEAPTPSLAIEAPKRDESEGPSSGTFCKQNVSRVKEYKYKHIMRFVNRRAKPKSSKVNPVVAIVQKKSGSKLPTFQGTIDYKNVVLLRKFITAEGKILPRRSSKLTAKQQRFVAKAIKNARVIGLLPFINKNQPVTY
jgi:small subunit ribosomal protein S18